MNDLEKLKACFDDIGMVYEVLPPLDGDNFYMLISYDFDGMGYPANMRFNVDGSKQ